MTKALTPGQLLAKVLADEGISVRQLGKLLHVPPARIGEMLQCERGFENVTLEKLDIAIPKYGIVWWHSVNEIAKSGRLFADENNKEL